MWIHFGAMFPHIRTFHWSRQNKNGMQVKFPVWHPTDSVCHENLWRKDLKQIIEEMVLEDLNKLRCVYD